MCFDKKAGAHQRRRLTKGVRAGTESDRHGREPDSLFLENKVVVTGSYLKSNVNIAS